MQLVNSEISELDIELIERQIGRNPRGLSAIAFRSYDGVPVVLQIRTVVEGELFPTLYWLSSKDFYKAIADIESAGFVKELDKRLQQDEGLKDRLHADHLRYIAQREMAMTSLEKEWVANQGLTEVLASMGVGGSRNWHTVRCLHMHYAHHLVESNCIGEILDDEFQLNKLAIKK